MNTGTIHFFSDVDGPSEAPITQCVWMLSVVRDKYDDHGEGVILGTFTSPEAAHLELGENVTEWEERPNQTWGGYDIARGLEYVLRPARLDRTITSAYLDDAKRRAWEGATF